MELHRVGQIKKSSLITEIASLIRESIISGVLPPNTHLIEQEISSHLSVSRGSLREALRLLESEGLVVDLPRRGFRVACLSVQDIEEVYSLRLLLEQEAMRRTLANVTQADLAELDQKLAEMFEAARSGNLAQVVQLDIDFHRTLWRIAGHRMLQQTLEEYISKISMYLSVQTHLYQDLNLGIADHQLILDAIRDKNEAAAIECLSRHLNDAAQVVLDFAYRHAGNEMLPKETTQSIR